MLAKNSRFVQTCPNVKETYLREENNEQTKKYLKEITKIESVPCT